MNRVAIEESFLSLIDHIRDFLDSQEEDTIPSVDLHDPLPDFWNEWFNPLLEVWTQQVRGDLSGFFLDQMKLHPGDVAIRYTALAVYDGLIQYLTSSHWSKDLPAPPAPPHQSPRTIVMPSWDPDIALLREDFRSVLHFANPRDIEDWRYIRWEITNSCLMEDWHRAFRLYDRARELGAVEEGDLRLLLGQFQFLLAFREAPIAPLQGAILQDNGPFLRKRDLVLHPFNWQPQLYDSPDSLSSLLFFASGLAVSTEDPEVSRPDRQILRDTIDALETARELRQLPPPYQAVLARCHFATGRFYDAAAQYERLQEKEFSGAWHRLSPYIYRALASSYVSAREPTKAIKALQLCSSKFPMEKDIYLKTAELQAGEADYHGVKETIRQATDNSPGLDEDWRYSTLLALGEIHPAPGESLSEMKVDPDNRDTIVGLLSEYWPPFEKLSDEGQKEWIKGTILSHFLLKQKSMLPIFVLDAHVLFTKALEIELRRRVFSPVREYFSRTEELHKLVERELGDKRDQDVSPFCQFVDKRIKFSLGFGSTVLVLCQSSRAPIFVALREWLDQRFPRLLPLAEVLNEVRLFRNDVVHGRNPTAGRVDIPDACRKLIESLLNESPSPS